LTSADASLDVDLGDGYAAVLPRAMHCVGYDVFLLLRLHLLHQIVGDERRTKLQRDGRLVTSRREEGGVFVDGDVEELDDADVAVCVWVRAASKTDGVFGCLARCAGAAAHIGLGLGLGLRCR
jgi:hypothetical protein